MAAIYRLTNGGNLAVSPGDARAFKRRHRNGGCLHRAIHNLKVAFRTSLITMAFVSFSSHASTVSGDKGFSESDVKAVFVLNFPNFITWPGTTDNPQKTICVFGAVALADSLALFLASSKMDNRRAAINFLREPDIDQHCDLLFVGRSTNEQTANVSPLNKSPHTLTVSDVPESAVKGGMIELALIDEKIQVIINWEAMKSKGFVVDSRLLQLATVVTSSTVQVEK